MRRRCRSSAPASTTRLAISATIDTRCGDVAFGASVPESCAGLPKRHGWLRRSGGRRRGQPLRRGPDLLSVHDAVNFRTYSCRWAGGSRSATSGWRRIASSASAITRRHRRPNRRHRRHRRHRRPRRAPPRSPTSPPSRIRRQPSRCAVHRCVDRGGLPDRVVELGLRGRVAAVRRAASGAHVHLRRTQPQYRLYGDAHGGQRGRFGPGDAGDHGRARPL